MKLKLLIVTFLLITLGGVYIKNKIQTNISIVNHSVLTTKMYCSSRGVLVSTSTEQSRPSYCIESNSAVSTVTPLVPFTYSFSIVDNNGNVLKDFTIEREKLLHLIVVRKDLQEFQHVHPVFAPATGMFTLSGLTLPTAGEYRIFADFTPKNAPLDAEGAPVPTNTFEDAVAEGAYAPQQLGHDSASDTVDDYSVLLATIPQQLTKGANMFTFTVTRNGTPVTNLEDYLGALGHAVILKEGTLDYIHTHALANTSSSQNGTIKFHVEFPSAGKYKVFMQFQHQGKILTSSFVVSVADVTGASMQHEMHH